MGILKYFVISFLLHLVWENAQAPLYDCYATFWQCFWICLKAVATGDMIFMAVIYLALAAVHRDIRWTDHPATFKHPGTWLLALLIGILLAVGFELWAVHVDHRWLYMPGMPIVPIIEVGLLPVLQMLVIPVLVLGFLSRRQSI